MRKWNELFLKASREKGKVYGSNEKQKETNSWKNEVNVFACSNSTLLNLGHVKC